MWWTELIAEQQSVEARSVWTAVTWSPDDDAAPDKWSQYHSVLVSSWTIHHSGHNPVLCSSAAQKWWRGDCAPQQIKWRLRYSTGTCTLKCSLSEKGVTHKNDRYDSICNSSDDTCTINVIYNDTKTHQPTPFFSDIICYCLIFSHLPSDCSYIWMGVIFLGCLECYFTQSQGEACYCIILLFIQRAGVLSR